MSGLVLLEYLGSWILGDRCGVLCCSLVVANLVNCDVLPCPVCDDDDVCVYEVGWVVGVEEGALVAKLVGYYTMPAGWRPSRL